jgi:hypothetical protein
MAILQMEEEERQREGHQSLIAQPAITHNPA